MAKDMRKDMKKDIKILLNSKKRRRKIREEKVSEV